MALTATGRSSRSSAHEGAGEGHGDQYQGQQPQGRQVSMARTAPGPRRSGTRSAGRRSRAQASQAHRPQTQLRRPNSGLPLMRGNRIGLRRSRRRPWCTHEVIDPAAHEGATQSLADTPQGLRSDAPDGQAGEQGEARGHGRS